jgi:hypothetical protein
MRRPPFPCVPPEITYLQPRIVSERPPAAERLRNPDALLSRGDLAELGLERRAVDADKRSCCLPGRQQERT